MTTLREMRKSRGLSLKQLEALTGINRGMLSKYENGLFLPSSKNLLRLAEFFEVSADHMLALIKAARKEGVA